MARIPYPDPSRYEREPLAERIKRERVGKLLNLCKMLLHSPPVAEGWLVARRPGIALAELRGRGEQAATRRRADRYWAAASRATARGPARGRARRCATLGSSAVDDRHGWRECSKRRTSNLRRPARNLQPLGVARGERARGVAAD